MRFEMKDPIIDFQDGSKVDMNKPTIRIQVFKASGKWYTSGSVELDSSQLWVVERSWDFLDMIKVNDPKIRHFSPLSGGFSKGYIYVIDAFLPPEVSGFCTYLVNLEDK